MLAPEPYLSACLKAIHRATVLARWLGWTGSSSLWNRVQRRDAEQLADLMDAVHNIPELIQNWERCDQHLLRLMLEEYDRKWDGDLLRTYDRELRQEG